MKRLYKKHICSPIGKLELICDDRFIIRLLFENDNSQEAEQVLEKAYGGCIYEGTCPLAETAAQQIMLYLRGCLRAFSVKPAFMGTDFQNRVWSNLMKIPYGKVVSYAALARLCGLKGARAVGRAVGLNPVPIIVPCHRVVASAGGLGGYRGGLQNKRRLLMTEGVILSDGNLVAHTCFWIRNR